MCRSLGPLRKQRTKVNSGEIELWANPRLRWEQPLRSEMSHVRPCILITVTIRSAQPARLYQDAPQRRKGFYLPVTHNMCTTSSYKYTHPQTKRRAHTQLTDTTTTTSCFNTKSISLTYFFCYSSAFKGSHCSKRLKHWVHISSVLV